MEAVTAVAGMGGVGKSALALRVAHLLEKEAPDGRIFVDLGGTSAQPLTPVAAMTRVIQALQPTAEVPLELELAQSLYRSCLDGKRVLLLLDNAENTAQVTPLIEWRAPTTLLIVTARHVIAGLEKAAPMARGQRTHALAPEPEPEIVPGKAPNTQPNVPATTTRIEFSSPLAATKTASGMISSDGIGGIRAAIPGCRCRRPRR